MHSSDTVKKHILNEKLIPLFYEDDLEVCINVVEALYKGGVRTIEFTHRGPKALDNFKALVAKKQNLPGLMLGIGTIKNTYDAQAYIQAGADFLISPVFDTAVADIAYLHKILWIPGCMTPTEIHVAQQAGCNLVKLFPGNVIGPGFIEAIRPLFNEVSFLVTGGVDATEESITKWLKAGAAGVGLGSKLITKEALQQKEYDKISFKINELLSIQGLK
jgi:2-dehydro-3-deoxyphosphogluconate aldolase/(4S)-4-hydroxy-2-oxoglutarate aldolase